MSGTAQVSIICVSINSLPADSNTSRKSFDTVEQADFQIYILRFTTEFKTQESWKPLLNTIPAFMGSSECFAEGNRSIYIWKSAAHQPIKFSPHQLEIPLISAKMEHREKERTQYEFCAFARPHGIQPSGRFE